MISGVPEVSPLRGYTSGYDSCALRAQQFRLLACACIGFASGGAVSQDLKAPEGAAE
ncbi:MAG: hypothetical protein IJ993_08355 [Akkermansia sp.]|nr:hypothetical protein [Akkermansia sp.]